MEQFLGLLPMILVLVIFYLIIFIPENKRKKRYAQMLDNLKVNDEIITKGGILGKVINIKDGYIILESGPDRARIKMDKNGIASVMSSDDKEENNEDKNKENK